MVLKQGYSSKNLYRLCYTLKTRFHSLNAPWFEMWCNWFKINAYFVKLKKKNAPRDEKGQIQNFDTRCFTGCFVTS